MGGAYLFFTLKNLKITKDCYTIIKRKNLFVIITIIKNNKNVTYPNNVAFNNNVNYMPYNFVDKSFVCFPIFDTTVSYVHDLNTTDKMIRNTLM